MIEDLEKGCEDSRADMRFVQNFTLPDFQATTFTLSILHYFNSFSDKTQKMSKISKHFTLPPAVTAGTNLSSAHMRDL